MARIQLQIYLEPSELEVFINLKTKDGSQKRRAATVDTGAQVSLLPKELMDSVEYRLTERSKIIIGQAGIAKQSFEAVEAFVTLFLEDQFGGRTQAFEARVWFAETDVILLGFDSILDRAVLHVDMPNRTGFLDFPQV